MSTSADLRIGGLTRLSTCDWPGQLVATVFCQGCPWDCVYCHNPALLSAAAAAGSEALAWREVRRFIEGRVGLLDGVVFSGGEPIAQRALLPAMREVRELGMRVALHSGGQLPERFAEALSLADWVGFDVKAPFAEYERITRVPGSGEHARMSLQALLASAVDYEVRTTVHPGLLGLDALRRMAGELSSLGVRRWALQAFRAQGTRPEAITVGLGPDPLTALPDGFGAEFEEFEVRA
ncbi:MAG: anaerobic ribonucleoside-triphosphate reductase activating protein [Coriobacteriia bacterium]|nr:anaerobic ribonucleoside-triphosphate reductase activating protein [Coriobacteriia bacterium]